jgi:hypothetical protein
LYLKKKEKEIIKINGSDRDLIKITDRIGRFLEKGKIRGNLKTERNNPKQVGEEKRHKNTDTRRRGIQLIIKIQLIATWSPRRPI